MTQSSNGSDRLKVEGPDLFLIVIFSRSYFGSNLIEYSGVLLLLSMLQGLRIELCKLD